MTGYQLSVTPDALQGRAAGAVSTLGFGATAVGTMLGGTLIPVLGADRTVLLCTAWLLVLAALTTANRAVRRAPRVAGAVAGAPAGRGAGTDLSA